MRVSWMRQTAAHGRVGRQVLGGIALLSSQEALRRLSS